MEENRETFKLLCKNAKLRIKNGFWKDCSKDVKEKMAIAKDMGLNESKTERFLKSQVSQKVNGEKEDEFYLKVKKMLLEYGEVSDAIGRLTDKEYFLTLSYEERQRYTLSIGERYLKALERFRAEEEFKDIGENTPVKRSM